MDQGTAHCLAKSFYHSLVSGLKYEIGTKAHSVQSSRSVSTTCQRKGCLLRFESNRTAISDGGEQNAASESIATKVCSKISSK